MVVKQFLTGVCVLVAFGCIDSFGAASIRATGVGASNTGVTSARSGSLRVGGGSVASSSVTNTSAVSGATSVSGGRMAVLPGGTPKLGNKPKLPSGGGTSTSLDGYATEAWTTENFQPAGDYLTESDLMGYATEDYVDDAIAGIAPNIQIAAGDDGKIYYCIAVGCENQPVGTSGYWAEFPTDGINGADGREIELQKTSTYIQWRYKTGDDTAWKNLVKLSDLKGAPGNSPSIRITQDNGVYTMNITNADGTTQDPISWAGGSSTGGITLSDVAGAGYLNELTATGDYVTATTDGNTGTIGLQNITASRNDITSTSEKLTRAMDVQSFVANYVANHGGAGSTTIVYNGLVQNESDLPTTGLTNGAAYYVVNEGSFYIWNGTGWDKVPFAENIVTTSDLNAALGGYQPKATANYRVSKSDGTWQSLATSVTSTGSNGVTSKGIYTWGTGAFQPKGEYVAKNGYTSADNGKIWRITKNDQDQYVLQLVDMPAGLDETALQQYLTTNNYVNNTYLTENNYLTSANVDTALSNTSVNPVQNKIVTKELNNKLNVAGHSSSDSGKAVIVDSNGNLVFGSVSPNIQLKYYNNALWYCAKSTPCTDTATPSAPDWASVNISSLNGKDPQFRVATCGSKASDGDCIQWAYVEDNPNWTDLITIREIIDSRQTKSTADFQMGMADGEWTAIDNGKSTYISISKQANADKYVLKLDIDSNKLIKSNTNVSQADEDDLMTLGGMACISTTKQSGRQPSGTCQGTVPSSLSGMTCYTQRGYLLINTMNTCVSDTAQSTFRVPDTCEASEFAFSGNNGYTYSRCFHEPSGLNYVLETRSGTKTCEQTTNQYTAPTAISGNTGSGTQENPYTKRGYTTITVEDTCDTSVDPQTSYIADSCVPFTKQYDRANPAIANISSVVSGIYQCTRGDNNSTYYYRASNGICALMLVDQSYTGPSNPISGETGIYTIKGKKVNTYLNPCTGDISEDYTQDSCGLLSMADLEANTVPAYDQTQSKGGTDDVQTSSFTYTCTCGGINGPCTASNTTYKWREGFEYKLKVKECENTTIEYTGPKAVSGQNYYSARGFLKTTVANACDSNSTPVVSITPDKCTKTQMCANANILADRAGSNTCYEVYTCETGGTNDTWTVVGTTYNVRVAQGNTLVCSPMILSQDYTGPSDLSDGYYGNKGKITTRSVNNPCSDNPVTVTTSTVDSCNLNDMGTITVTTYTELEQKSGNSSQFGYTCTCGGTTSTGVCSTENATYPWKHNVNVNVTACEYLMSVTASAYEGPASSKAGETPTGKNYYTLVKRCGENDETVISSECTTTTMVAYEGPADRSGSQTITNDTGKCTSANPCYSLPGRTKTTIMKDCDTNPEEVEVEDKCDVATMTYDAGNSSKTYYDCISAATGNAYKVRRDSMPGTVQTLKSVKTMASDAKDAANTASANATDALNAANSKIGKEVVNEMLYGAENLDPSTAAQNSVYAKANAALQKVTDANNITYISESNGRNLLNVTETQGAIAAVNKTCDGTDTNCVPGLAQMTQLIKTISDNCNSNETWCGQLQSQMSNAINPGLNQ